MPGVWPVLRMKALTQQQQRLEQQKREWQGSQGLDGLWCICCIELEVLDRKQRYLWRMLHNCMYMHGAVAWGSC